MSETSSLVDITGLQAKAIKGWEERTTELSKPEFFTVRINIQDEAWTKFTPEEQVRLKKKLEYVCDYGSYLAAGMVKGTVKYETDEYSLDKWFAHLIGEGADFANYQMLLFMAFQQYKKVLDMQVNTALEESISKAAKGE